MNPSAPDWIQKFLNYFDHSELLEAYNSELDFYHQLKKTGFIFGVSVKAVPKKKLGPLKLTKEEFTKMNLFHALYFQYYKTTGQMESEGAIDTIIQFYRNLEKGKTGFFHKFSMHQNPASTLEHILSARLQETNSLLKKNTVSLLTYALLYLDVLAFKKWIEDHESVKTYYKKLENILLKSCFYTLKSKNRKTKYDTLLIDLYDSSTEYVLEVSGTKGLEFLENVRMEFGEDNLERNYILDLCCLTVWEDLKLDDTEKIFLEKLTEILHFEKKQLSESLDSLLKFSAEHTAKIFIFEYSHPIKQFYKQSAATVKLLIIRNKDRLTRELEESGELVVLLGQSTLRDLSKEEKKKVKEQLLDICKSIPSLTVFLLPGGGVLLPLLVKFIPKLLPSSFQDNKIEFRPPSKRK